tara:strand:- start:21531 stop:21725 length:195 start_codon:yes stop_codon:yes gene_type:complete
MIMKFKLLKDAPFIGKKGDVVEIKESNHIAILKFNKYINEEYVETKLKAKRVSKKVKLSDSDSE